MSILTVEEFQEIIKAAFNQWLDSKAESFTVGDVQVDVSRGVVSFDCGVPGHCLDNNDAERLKEWVNGHQFDSHGWNPKMRGCKIVGNTCQLNVFLNASVSFNFHVNLSGKCSPGRHIST